VTSVIYTRNDLLYRLLYRNNLFSHRRVS